MHYEYRQSEIQTPIRLFYYECLLSDHEEHIYPIRQDCHETVRLCQIKGSRVEYLPHMRSHSKQKVHHHYTYGECCVVAQLEGHYIHHYSYWIESSVTCKELSGDYREDIMVRRWLRFGLYVTIIVQFSLIHDIYFHPIPPHLQQQEIPK